MVNQFLKKCARVTNRIIMILPRRFYANIPKSVLSLEWQVVYKDLLEPDVFKTKKKIYSSFLYLRRTDGYTRPIKDVADSIQPIGFSIISFPNPSRKDEQFDLVFWQSGGKAGCRTTIGEINNSRAYGLIFHDIEKKERVLNSTIVITKTQGTNNRSYITVNDICQIINPL